MAITTQVIYGVMLVCLLSSLAVFGYERFMKKIPNANYVKNPISGKMHPGVGHFAEGGGGPRNCFGMDFKKANLMWTKKLCMSDSDGDGKTNGEELGDPKCEWKEGSVMKLTKDQMREISAPGICEPMSRKCKPNCKAPMMMTTKSVGA